MSTRDPRWLRSLDRLYGLALRLYPRRFRAQWEQPMRQAFRDRCREVAAGQRRPLSLLLELLPDLAIGAGREHSHSLQDASSMKRNLLFALLLALAGITLFHDRFATIANSGIDAARQWWTQRQQHAYNLALQEYRYQVAATVARQARTPREHAIAGLLYSAPAMVMLNSEDLHQVDVRAGDKQALQQQRARLEWSKATSGADPLALWLSITDCPLQSCDAAGALAQLRRLEADNAAVGVLELEAAAKAGDATRMRAAFDGLASATRYHDHSDDLMRALLSAYDRVPVPAGLRGRMQDMDDTPAMAATMLAAGQWMVAGISPGYARFMRHCNPAQQAEDDQQRNACLHAARLMADSGTAIAEAVGLRVWYRHAQGEPEAAMVRQRTRDFRWQLEQYGKLLDFRHARSADIMGWRAAWQAGGGEMEVAQRILKQRGIPLSAPADFQTDDRYFDPNR